MDNHLKALLDRARAAFLSLSILEAEHKNTVLRAFAKALRQQTEALILTNKEDVERSQQMVAAGELSQSSLKRLILTEAKIEQMALNCESVAELPEPLGKISLGTQLDEGLELFRQSTPIGVVLAIFESRPEVVVQITALTLKSGNAVILKGGKEAQATNLALYHCLRKVLEVNALAPVDALQMVTTRAEVENLLDLNQGIDLVVPRGGNELVKSIQIRSKAAVLAHADGICHVFIDRQADVHKARAIVIDAKTEYPAVCNAMETLLVDEEFDAQELQAILRLLREKKVELRGCGKTQKILATTNIEILPATEQDWQTEYTDLILSIKLVNGVAEAIEHINQYGSKHTDGIITENAQTAQMFLNQVDSAGVYWNASTRFADGYRYGFGAEVGISTSKTHARGPVGLEGLLIYKYLLLGQGHVVATYNQGHRQFSHQAIEQPEARLRQWLKK